MHNIVLLTSRTLKADNSFMSSESSVNQLEARINFVKSVCSHHLSSVLSRDTVLDSSGTSMLILHTSSGTKIRNIFKFYYQILEGNIYHTVELAQFIH